MFALNSLIIFPILFQVNACYEPQVTVKLGTIRGTRNVIEDGYIDEYLGVPYAQPPVGALRFSKPLPLETKWEKTLLAQKYAPSCYQRWNVSMSENCLFLNIWSPKNASKNNQLPVMLWIHGGSFASGSGDYNGSILSFNTQTVVVTINYRLNLFGFLFGNTDDIPGNVGLYDQTLALKWVYENIENFGGNRNMITIFGLSAGGWSVSHHLTSRFSKSYFKNAILMSGVNMDNIAVDTQNSAFQKASVLSQIVGCGRVENSSSLPREVVDCLRAKDAELLVNALLNPQMLSAGENLPFSLIGATFIPIYGEEFIPKEPRKMWKEKDFKTNASILFGTAFNEIEIKGGFSVIQPKLKHTESMRIFLNKYIPTQFLTSSQIEEYLKIHFIGVDEENKIDALQAATQLFNDITFHCPSASFAEALSKSNSVYQYVFNYKSKNDNPGCDTRYPCHGSDVTFIFGNPPSLPDDTYPSKNWMKILGDFAKSGKAFWPSYYRTNEKQLVTPFYEFKGNLSANYTQIGFRYFRCSIWKSMVI